MPMPAFPPARLGAFRNELHGCVSRRADALFELGDAWLCTQVITHAYHGIERARRTPQPAYSFLRHTGLSVS
jgi:hypothetical protein